MVVGEIKVLVDPQHTWGQHECEDEGDDIVSMSLDDSDLVEPLSVQSCVEVKQCVVRLQCLPIRMCFPQVFSNLSVQVERLSRSLLAPGRVFKSEKVSKSVLYPGRVPWPV